jgi:hypothetical protein
MPKAALLSEQRRSKRVFIKIPVRYHEVHGTKNPVPVDYYHDAVKVSYATNVSSRGMGLVTEEILKEGGFLHLDIFLPLKPVHISTLAKVIWAEPAKAGLRFFAMKVEDTKALKEYISQFD